MKPLSEAKEQIRKETGVAEPYFLAAWFHDDGRLTARVKLVEHMDYEFITWKWSCRCWQQVKSSKQELHE